MTEQFQDRPNTHKYTTATHVTSWTVIPLFDVVPGIKHYFHVPTDLVDEIERQVRERLAAAPETDGLREAVLSGPPVRFPNLPDQPTGPDVLDAIAAWMDRVDERDGNPNHDVQNHLRDWATRLRAALRAAAPSTPDGGLAELRVLSDAATPGRWYRYTVGHRSVRQAAGVVTQALFSVNVDAEVRPLMTDLSWLDTDATEEHIALTGNGPKQTDNAEFIAAAVNFVREWLAAAHPQDPPERENR